jgi:hypothetical protein
MAAMVITTIASAATSAAASGRRDTGKPVK